MLDIGDSSKRKTHYFSLIFGFLVIVAGPILMTPLLETGLSNLGN